MRALIGLVVLGAVVSLISPELDRLASTALLVVVGLVVLFWLAVFAIGEVRYAREYARSYVEPEPYEDEVTR